MSDQPTTDQDRIDQRKRLIEKLEASGAAVNQNPTLADQRRANEGATMIFLNRSRPLKHRGES